MPEFLIERHIPGIERMTSDELAAVARKSNAVLADLGAEIRWQHSYIVDGQLFCLYQAPDAELIQEHARLGGFPVTDIKLVSGMLEPAMG